MTAKAFSVVHAARTSIEAELRISYLRGAGFHPVDLGTASHIYSFGADVAYYIEVPTQEAEAAKEFLRSFDESSPAT